MTGSIVVISSRLVGGVGIIIHDLVWLTLLAIFDGLYVCIGHKRRLYLRTLLY